MTTPMVLPLRILLLLVLGSSLFGESARVLVIRDIAIFDSEARTMLPAQSVVIRGERIEAVGPALKAPRGAEVLDGRGRYLIPGLIDAHTHVVTVLYWAQMTGDATFPYYLANGVTSIRNTGDRIAAQKILQRYAMEHPASSPRLFLASDLIDGDPPIHRDIGWPLTSPEKVPAFVEDMARWGVQTLKIYARCAPEVARRVIEEGHRHGLVVTGHLGKYRIDEAIADGIDCLEHIESVADFLRADPRDRHSLDLTSEPPEERLRNWPSARIRRSDPDGLLGNSFFCGSAGCDLTSRQCPHAQAATRFLGQGSGDQTGELQLRTDRGTRAHIQKVPGIGRQVHRAGVPLLAGTDAPSRRSSGSRFIMNSSCSCSRACLRRTHWPRRRSTTPGS